MTMIPCIQCGTSVPITATLCPTCGDPLDDERRSLYQSGQLHLYDQEPPAFFSDPHATPHTSPHAAPRASTPQSSTERHHAYSSPDPLDDPLTIGPDRPVDATLVRTLPTDPIEIAPDPWFGPVLRRTVRYLLSADAIEIRSGLVTRSTHVVSLWRVGSNRGDIELTQGPIQRMRGVGTIRIATNDPDLPYFALQDIHEPERWAELIRRGARDEQMSRNRLNIGDVAVDGNHLL